MRILILGVSGMLGNAMFKILSQSSSHEIYGTARSSSVLHHFSDVLQKKISIGIDVENTDSLIRLFDSLKPEIVINCIGLIKQLEVSDDPLITLPINSIFPHRLANLCKLIKSKVIHISTDCVFSGKKGFYNEQDQPDASDLYGRSKLLGELYYSHAITIRTSIIGHEINTKNGLIEWFLSQDKNVSGYTKAIFSGLPTFELGRVIRDYILPKEELCGLYHVSSMPISKYDLLNLVNHEYKKNIKINPSDDFVIDRSLDSSYFQEITGYSPPTWKTLISQMRSFN